MSVPHEQFVAPRASAIGGGVLAGDVVADSFDGWSDDLVAEFETRAFNFEVGSTLLSETDDLKVWDIHLDPGQRLGVHRHVLDYFWTALTTGSSRQHTDDGVTREVSYTPGQTRHFRFADHEYLLHDLENIGTTRLTFVTVEHKVRSEQLSLQVALAHRTLEPTADKR